MKGTLELLCGPSGVGKTSYIRERILKWREEGIMPFNRVYRWTTRDPRADKREKGKEYTLDQAHEDLSELIGWDGEGNEKLYTVDGAISVRMATGRFESKYGGSFVTVLYFNNHESELVGVHNFPQESFKYGYPHSVIRSKISKGEYLFEQIVSYSPIAKITDEFSSTRKILFLASKCQIEKRILGRSKCAEEYQLRVLSTLESIEHYVTNTEDFDEVIYRFPRRIEGDQVKRIAQEYIEKANNREGFVIEYQTGAEFRDKFVNFWGKQLDALSIMKHLDSHLNSDSESWFIAPKYELNFEDMRELSKTAHDLMKRGERNQLQMMFSDLSQAVSQFETREVVRYLNNIMNAPEPYVFQTYGNTDDEISPLSRFCDYLMESGQEAVAQSISVLLMLRDYSSREKFERGIHNIRRAFRGIKSIEPRTLEAHIMQRTNYIAEFCTKLDESYEKNIESLANDQILFTHMRKCSAKGIYIQALMSLNIGLDVEFESTKSRHHMLQAMCYADLAAQGPRIIKNHMDQFLGKNLMTPHEYEGLWATRANDRSNALALSYVAEEYYTLEDSQKMVTRAESVGLFVPTKIEEQQRLSKIKRFLTYEGFFDDILPRISNDFYKSIAALNNAYLKSVSSYVFFRTQNKKYDKSFRSIVNNIEDMHCTLAEPDEFEPDPTNDTICASHFLYFYRANLHFLRSVREILAFGHPSWMKMNIDELNERYILEANENICDMHDEMVEEIARIEELFDAVNT